MYCGDETGAFIGDIGSHTSRFGYGGDDNPKYVVPSYVYKDSGEVPMSCYQYREDVKPIYRLASPDDSEYSPNAFLQQGDRIENWDAWESMWKSSFDVLRVRDSFKHTTGSTKQAAAAGGTTSETIRSAKEDETLPHPLLAVDSGCTHVMNSASDKSELRKQRMKMTQVMMESLNASSVFIAPAPMLAAFSHGRQTGVVVNVGAGGCRVTPVIDGLLLHNAQRRNGRGGDWLGTVMNKALLEEVDEVVPRYKLRNPDATPGPHFQQWAMNDLMYEFRSSEHVHLPPYRMDLTTPFIYPDTEMQVEQDAEPSTYELPDGTMVDLTTRIGKDLCRVPELFFSDQVPFVKEGEEEKSLLEQHATLSNEPLHKLIHSSLTAVGDADARKELCGNILLVGGSSLFPNMEQRLSYEISTITPNTYKCRVLASRNSVERSCASWIGGSILTSLGSFQQLWLSRKEYEEYGEALAIQRFP